jgi:hypothetical protein
MQAAAGSCAPMNLSQVVRWQVVLAHDRARAFAALLCHVPDSNRRRCTDAPTPQLQRHAASAQRSQSKTTISRMRVCSAHLRIFEDRRHDLDADFGARHSGDEYGSLLCELS